jgi:MFS transporter, SP family, galactose:H+ symporter
LFLPSSPRWLILSGKEARARRVLQQIRKPDQVEVELSAIKASAHHKALGIRHLFKKPFSGLACLAFLLFMFQQLSGINTMMYYAPIIYQHAGFHGTSAQLAASVADGVVFVLATIAGVLLIDRVGRRVLFNIGFLGMVLCLLLLAADYYGLIHYYVSFMALAAVLSYIIFFGISLGPLSYLLMSELFPLNIKSTGMALASCANWGFNVLVSATFLSLINAIGIASTFVCYAVCTFIGFILCYLLVPETKGVTLDAIEQRLYDGVGLRKLGG